MRIWCNREKPRQVSLDLLSFILGLKRRQLQYLSKRGILKKASHRSFLLTESVKGYIEYLKGRGRWAGDEKELDKALLEIENSSTALPEGSGDTISRQDIS